MIEAGSAIVTEPDNHSLAYYTYIIYLCIPCIELQISGANKCIIVAIIYKTVCPTFSANHIYIPHSTLTLKKKELQE